VLLNPAITTKNVMQTLNNCQQTALTNLIRWFHGQNQVSILQGKAGTGKTYLIDSFLTQLGNRVTPLLLADTNEACKVLAKATGNKYAVNTVCSALKLTLQVAQSQLVLKQTGTPTLEKYTLLIVDEASQLDDQKIDLLIATGIYILFVGHKSQLPPIDNTQSVAAICDSPVFTRGFPTFNLESPVRNTGAISTFCDKAEQLIYTRGILADEFRQDSKFMREYLLANPDKVLRNEIVMLAFTNKEVDSLNEIARYAIFGKDYNQELFLEKDRIIFRSPTAIFGCPLYGAPNKLNNIFKVENKTLTTNTRGTVKRVNSVELMGIGCYELFVELDDVFDDILNGYVYVPLVAEEYGKLRAKYHRAALWEHNPVKAAKKWVEYHELQFLLGDTKHSYALTVHCSQGSTIDTVFVHDNDIDKCLNMSLRKKLRYVAYSRAKTNLFRIK